MLTVRGRSRARDAAQAIDEITADWGDVSPDLLLVFSSTSQDAGAIAKELQSRFPNAQMAGCSTAGEYLDGHAANDSVVVMGLVTPRIRWALACVEGLADCDQSVDDAVSQMFHTLDLDPELLDPATAFCMVFFDGLSMREETVVSKMADALEGVALVGGSAGDDLKFVSTQVVFNGIARSDAAVMVLGHTDRRFEIIKHQHFTADRTGLVVTKADPDARRVYELNGRPAHVAYSEALGRSAEEVDADFCFLHPLTFGVEGELYVRSIRQIEPDGSLVFYCAVEEGMVLDIGGHEDMENALRRDLETLHKSLGDAEVFIYWNCILRGLEARGEDLCPALSKHLRALSDHSIGFDTYGEQLNGLHINQTLVGLAFARD